MAQLQAPTASLPRCVINIENQLRMQGGENEFSYAYNSSLQAGIIQLTEDLLMEALQRMELPLHAPLRIADLGCSSGPNTLYVVNSVVNKLQKRYESLGQNIPEFQVFFSDLASNDFNALFSSLPPYLPSQAIASNDLTKRSYFVGGVPGTFYGRLFPSASLHVIYTANSLHWLSKIPEAVQNKLSPAWNEGKSWISPSNKATAQAYSNQARDDLYNFLSCRAKEMTSGGLLVISALGRASTDPCNQYSFLDTNNKHFFYDWIAEFDNCWNDLVKENIIKEEVRDSFNIPMYNRSAEEVEEAVRDFSQYFAIHELKLVKMNVIDFTKIEVYGEENSGWYSHARSVFGPLIEAHVGSSISELFFQRLKVRATLLMKEGDKASSNVLIAATLFRK